MYLINFIVTRKKFCSSLHYNGSNSYLFVNVEKTVKFKAKDSAILATPLYLGNISKDWSVDNMKKTGFTGYVYDAIAAYDILDIHKYLMKKMTQCNMLMFKCLSLLENAFLQDQYFYRLEQA